jgi:hypothetical protein
MSKFTKTLIVAALTFFGATAAMAHDRPNNPPGPVGGPGTNWHNPPGPVGGPGASPYRHHRAAKHVVVVHHHYRHHPRYRHFVRHHERHYGHPVAYNEYGYYR